MSQGDTSRLIAFLVSPSTRNLGNALSMASPPIEGKGALFHDEDPLVSLRVLQGYLVIKTHENGCILNTNTAPPPNKSNRSDSTVSPTCKSSALARGWPLNACCSRESAQRGGMAADAEGEEA